ncbi:MAG: AMP-binding protein [Acidimicrobiales bacterium]
MANDEAMNLADVFEAFVAAVPDRDAVVQGDRRVTWSAFDRRASGVASALLGAGLARGDRVALYLYNSPEYLEAYVAALKVSLAPVNTNYRYRDDELLYLWDDADAAAVVFHGSFVDTVERIRGRLPKVRLWLWVDDGTGGCPSWARPYDDAAAEPPAPPPWPRSGDDLVFVYTGGTTGIPKGVMWSQHALLGDGLGDADKIGAHVAARLERSRAVTLPAAPLMHGTGAMGALRGLLAGGTAVLLAGRRFDAHELWDAVARERVGTITVVGDAFARPLLDALAAEPSRWDLSCLRAIVSAGAMFSEGVKGGLLEHLPEVTLTDQLGSSENAGAGFSRSGRDRLHPTGSFRPQPGVRVLDESWRDVEPGSGQVGVIAIPGGARGYHKDPAKSAATWPVIDGKRYTVAGDYATVEADGTIRLLGRGSVCINTGGEKVFPEEVEEALKTHDAVRDAVVVGVPDERFGQAIAAVVEVTNDTTDAELVAHVKARLAGYKAPRYLVRVDSVGRAPNGKADYAGAREQALHHIHRAEVAT